MNFLNRKTTLLKILVCITLILLISIAGFVFYKNINSTNIDETVQISEPIEQNTIEPVESIEPVKKDISVNISAIGDVMCHSTNFKAAYKNGTYDFSSVFSDITPYIKNADIAIGNLETTFAGEAKGYSGYPTFNTPASLARKFSRYGIRCCIYS